MKAVASSYILTMFCALQFIVMHYVIACFFHIYKMFNKYFFDIS